jgi:hypothetical protein
LIHPNNQGRGGFFSVPAYPAPIPYLLALVGSAGSRRVFQAAGLQPLGQSVREPMAFKVNAERGIFETKRKHNRNE